MAWGQRALSSQQGAAAAPARPPARHAPARPLAHGLPALPRWLLSGWPPFQPPTHHIPCRFINYFFDNLEFEPIQKFCQVRAPPPQPQLF